MSYRAAKAGLARDTQVKIDNQFDIEEASKCLYWIGEIDNQFDIEEASKCLYWIGEVTGEPIQIPQTEDKREFSDFFHTTLKDGVLLCRLIDAFLPADKKIDFSKKTFLPTTTQAFAMARERERIGIFLIKTQEIGVPNTNIFQTDYLYEKTNLVHVCACIGAIGIEAQSKPGYSYPAVWPKKNEQNIRTFTDEQLQAGNQIIGLQYGSNKGASQAGMTFGKARMILD